MNSFYGYTKAGVVITDPRLLHLNGLLNGSQKRLSKRRPCGRPRDQHAYSGAPWQTRRSRYLRESGRFTDLQNEGFVR